jgi:tRNA(adenine34) deaminase
MIHNPQHTSYMRHCLQLAEAAKEVGNVPVGSLIVRGEMIIAMASETLPMTLDVTGHAEVLAIGRACAVLQTRALHDCTLYTTAEPCWMCSYVIRETRLHTVVIGAETHAVGGITSQYPLLVATDIPVWGAPPQIITGVLRAECLALRQRPA